VNSHKHRAHWISAAHSPLPYWSKTFNFSSKVTAFLFLLTITLFSVLDPLITHIWPG
jgi:hypothetical protein